MRFKKSGYRPLLITALALTLAIGLISVGLAALTQFLELDQNVGFDSLGGASYDWANSGANSGACAADPSDGNKIKCSGTNGVFDGGIFNGATTPPTAPAPTATALADPTIPALAFGVDPLSVDTSFVHNPPDDPTAPLVNCGVGDPTVYTSTGGEVNGDILNTETFATGSIPNKDEISNVYALSHKDDAAGVNEIYAAFERVVNNGDSHVDLEFLQSAVAVVPGSKPALFPCAGKFQGSRSQGDLLLSVDFTNGGAVGNPVLHQWSCNTTPASPTGTVCNPNKTKTTPAYVEVVLPPGVAIQSFNSSPIGCGGWACRNADGTENTTINSSEFYEIGLDLNAIGFTGCLSTFLPHTRSSQSFTATLKDFELIKFDTCKPSTNLTKTVDKPVITIGDTVTYTYTETNDGKTQLKPPVAGNLNSFVTDDKCSPVTYVSGDVNSNNILDVGEVFTFTCTAAHTQNTTNTAIGHGIFTVNGVNKDVTFCTDPNNPPPNTICDQDERGQTTVTVRTPGTTLRKTASASCATKTTVTYTFTETNAGQVALTPPACLTHAAPCVASDRNSLVSDPDCTPAFVSGDNGNNIFDPGEVWTFSCTKVIDGPGTVTNTAKGHGVDNLGRDVTVCPGGISSSTCFQDSRETDTKTVTTTCSATVSGGK